MAITLLLALALPMNAPPVEGRIERLDPAIDKLVPSDAKIEVLASGFDWSEGPVWVKDGGYLVFSDVPRHIVLRWKEDEGVTDWLKPSGYTGKDPRGEEMGSNGLALDTKGRLVLCQHGDRRVARLDAPFDKSQAKFVTLADKFTGKRFNSPNDVVCHSSGALYFTDPPYGLVKGWEDPARELKHCGVYRVDPNGKVEMLTDKMTRPNGIALSPDERTLYVANSDEKLPIWMAFDLDDEGRVSGERVFFDATELLKKHEGLPDGLKVDKQGNLFATGPGGVLVFTPEGKHLGTISTGTHIANCAFGDDGKTLYLTSDDYLCRVKLSTTGLGF
jgi:gluconolactonase